MTINAFLIAVKVVRDMPDDMSNLDKIKRLDALDKAAMDAADEIEELRDLCRKMLKNDVVRAADIDRLRELVGVNDVHR